MLLSHPLFLIGASAALFQVSVAVYERSGRAALLQPILITSLGIVTVLLMLEIPYVTYRDGTSVLQMLLGPAIVALAVPVYQSIKMIRTAVAPLLFLLPLCVVLVSSLGVALAFALDLSASLKFGLALRSVSAPVAIEIAGRLGEDKLITVLCVIITGISGAVVAPAVVRAIGITDERARGLTFGLIAHAFGVVRALEISPLSAAFGTVAMVFAACLAAIAMPFIVAWLPM